MTRSLDHGKRRSYGLTANRSSRILAAGLCVALLIAARATATDLPGVYAAALDQPRINAVLRRTPTGPVLSAEVDGETVYNIEAFFDTGASGVLLSHETAEALGVQKLRYPNPVSGQLVEFEDVGVAGSQIFNVSEQLHIGLSPFFESFSSPPLNTYTQNFGPIRLQIAPPVSDPLLDPILDVFGMPTMAGKVMVMDPRPADDPFGPNGGPIHTFLYNPGTPFNPATPNTDPGIPDVDRHIKLSYGSFDRFTLTTPAGAPGPTLRENPFIGPNPVLQLDPNPPADNTPPITITFGSQSATGSWLFDTGAAASIISKEQAAKLHIRYRPDTEDDPVLEIFDPMNPNQPGQDVPDQFTLPIGGIGGTTTPAGFYLDSLLLRTMEGNATDDNDPNHIRYQSAAVLVADIGLEDPNTHETLTLDGVFGMNMLVASADIETFDLLEGYYNWLTFDDPNRVLGLDLKDVLPQPANEWNRLSSGVWGAAGNWSLAVIPNGNEASVVLGTFITSSAAIDLEATDRTVRILRFKHPNQSYTVTSSGGGTLVLDSPAGSATIQFDVANNASHEISAPLWIKSNVDFHGFFTDLRLTLSGGQTWDAGRTLSVRSGVLRYNLDNADVVAVGGGNSLVIDEGAKVTLAGTKSPLAAGNNYVDVINNSAGALNNSAGGLEVAAGNHAAGFIAGSGNTSLAAATSLSVEGIQQSSLTLAAGSQLTVRASPSNAGISVLGTLAIDGGTAPTARFDLTNKAAVIDYTGTSPVATVRSQIIAGRGGPGLNKPWNGQGITSSTVAADNSAQAESRSIAYAENAALPLVSYTVFHGQSVDNTSVLLAYTRTGDANLDGVVNNDDVTIVGANYAPGAPKPSWALGDFDYNGFVDNDDVTLLGAFYNPSAPPLIAPAPGAIGLAAVPEPASVLLLLLGAAAMAIMIDRRRPR